jgi:hypothetical protein
MTGNEPAAILGLPATLSFQARESGRKPPAPVPFRKRAAQYYNIESAPVKAGEPAENFARTPVRDSLKQ